MIRTIFGVLASVALTLIVVIGSSASDETVRDLLMDYSETVDEHNATAEYYAEKAQEQRREAIRHEKMGARYAAGRMKDRRRQAAHCESIASLHLQLAAEYEALGRNHRKEADLLMNGAADTPQQPR